MTDFSEDNSELICRNAIGGDVMGGDATGGDGGTDSMDYESLRTYRQR